jgi:PHAX RNA-binding domain
MDDELTALAEQIANALGETAAEPVKLLFRLVHYFGAEESTQLLAEVLAIQAAGGMPTRDNKRQHTLGGEGWMAELGGSPVVLRLPTLVHTPESGAPCWARVCPTCIRW